ncbi:flavodoxin [Photobacterium sp. 1_MG-2023]|uniref:flavodoxin n=1 Tax=Photobacterium sp. 1_MG-2023 TaxID=3062646 RepID=UPI0026E19220|nr:flavodoxin [Photobacterium sp. 1_MG-2023]MDO6707795.1 flavodoxin [Photobacterium sp. 1_MG-2023]
MANIGVFVGSVFGGAEEVAEEIVSELKANGHQAELFVEPNLDDFLAYRDDVALVVTSTTGQGEIPENLLPLFTALNDQFPLMPALNYGVIAMGDSSYGEDRYCGGGRQFDALLQELQAKPVTARLDIDACVNFDATEAALPWLKTFMKQVS